MGYREQFFAECKEDVGDLSGLSVLVAGCGPGHDCKPFIEAGARTVVGLDPGEDLGREYTHPSVSYSRQGLENCNLRPDQFDVVFCIATMEHVQGIEPAFAQMVRLLRPGGLVYSVAAPLWNSRRGHHMDCLNPFPWIHLRFGPEELLSTAQAGGVTHHDGFELPRMMDYLFRSSYFNRAPARRYQAACADLPVSQVVRHDLWFDGADELTPSLQAELEVKGYSKDELLATSHTFIARK